VQQLRRLAKPESWHRGFADALAAYLEGYFAEVEPTVQRERLAREVAENALWQEILLAMRDARGLNQVDIGKQIAARAPGVASSKSAISIALEDLRVRELVEHVPGKTDRRERIHSLTMRGRELLAEPAVSSITMKTTFDRANAGSIGDDGEVSPSRVPRTEPIPAESEVGTERGDSPRARRLRSEPSPAGR
jgi:hypothetical protein